MAADDVIGQGGAGVVRVPDLAVGHQAQLDEGLEAVADAKHEAVPVLQQVHDRVGDLAVAEEGGDELAGAVGLVAAGEAAGDEDDLALTGCGGKASGEAATSAAERLFSTRISGTRPARSTARALSYSQLVPGNTGISTSGAAQPILGAAGEGGASSTGMASGPVAVRMGNTSSRVSS